MYFVLGSAAVAGFKSDKSHGDYKLGETNSAQWFFKAKYTQKFMQKHVQIRWFGP